MSVVAVVVASIAVTAVLTICYLPCLLALLSPFLRVVHAVGTQHASSSAPHILHRSTTCFAIRLLLAMRIKNSSCRMGERVGWKRLPKQFPRSGYASVYILLLLTVITSLTVVIAPRLTVSFVVSRPSGASHYSRFCGSSPSVLSFLFSPRCTCTSFCVQTHATLLCCTLPV